MHQSLTFIMLCPRHRLAGGAGVPLRLLGRLALLSRRPTDCPVHLRPTINIAGCAGVPLCVLGRLGRLLWCGGGALGGGPRPLLHVVGESPFGVCCEVERSNNLEQGWGAEGRPLLHVVGESPWGAVALGCTPNTRCWSRAGERKGGCCFMRCLRAVGAMRWKV